MPMLEQCKVTIISSLLYYTFNNFNVIDLNEIRSSLKVTEVKSKYITVVYAYGRVSCGWEIKGN